MDVMLLRLIAKRVFIWLLVNKGIVLNLITILIVMELFMNNALDMITTITIMILA